jgi:translation initiation factor 2B subunit (eIF-2B alpha/beta/delta family)
MAGVLLRTIGNQAVNKLISTEPTQVSPATGQGVIQQKVFIKDKEISDKKNKDNVGEGKKDENSEKYSRKIFSLHYAKGQGGSSP